MPHLPLLIQDLAVILITAGFIATLSRYLKFPVAFGYLLAGFFVGPFSPFETQTLLEDPENLKVWAELGVIFLLFGLGLEFSFRKLFKTGFSTVFVSLFELGFLLVSGYLLGRFWGWSPLSSLFMGALLSISSTTMILKSFEDQKLKTRQSSQLVLGVLIFEDVLAVFLMVILSGLAITGQWSGADLLSSGIRILFFLGLWTLLGISILPSLFRRIGKHLSDEILIVVAIGLCLGMVFVSNKAGLSSALGAFMMGSLLSETSKAERIHFLIGPLKSIFGAIFFVTIGMLFDYRELQQIYPLVLVCFFVVILGKIFANTFAGVMAGFEFKTSLQAGMSLAQIGEFSFILAGLAATLPNSPKSIYPLAIAVATLTSLTTPFLISRSVGFSEWVENKVISKRIHDLLTRYRILSQRGAVNIEWQNLLRNQILSVVIGGIWVVFVALVYNKFGRENLASLFDWWIGELLAFGGLLAVSAPVLWALSLGTFKDKKIIHFWRNHSELRIQMALLLVLKVLISLVLILFLMGQTIGFRGGLLVAFGGIAVLTLVFSSTLEKLYFKVLSHLSHNFSAGDEFSIRPGVSIKLEDLVPWDAHMIRHVIPGHSEIVGQSLEELKVRERFGVTIALIKRGEKKIWVPTREIRIMPGDHVYLIGNDSQIEEFRSFVDSSETGSNSLEKDLAEEALGLDSLQLDANSPFLSKTIRNSGLREAVMGLVVGVEREGKRILNPDSTWVLEAGDILWIVGNKTKIRNIKKAPISNS